MILTSPSVTSTRWASAHKWSRRITAAFEPDALTGCRCEGADHLRSDGLEAVDTVFQGWIANIGHPASMAS